METDWPVVVSAAWDAAVILTLKSSVAEAHNSVLSYIAAAGLH